MLNAKKKYFCSFLDIFNVNLGSYLHIKYIINWFSKYSQIRSVLSYKFLKILDGHITLAKWLAIWLR